MGKSYHSYSTEFESIADKAPRKIPDWATATNKKAEPLKVRIVKMWIKFLSWAIKLLDTPQ